jgi:hypothetical protein
MGCVESSQQSRAVPARASVLRGLPPRDFKGAFVRTVDGTRRTACLGPARPGSVDQARAAGTTLIEVLAGLVILGTLLVSLAIARGRFLRTWTDADRRIAATREADGLVEGWLSGSPSSVPLSSQGFTDDAARRLWRTTPIPSPEAATVGAVVVRLQVFENTSAAAPLCQVDFLLRDPRLPTRPTTRGSR